MVVDRDHAWLPLLGLARGAAVMARALVWRLGAAATVALLAGACDGAGDAADGPCVADPDCGHCGRCADGRCVIDLAATTCVLESSDPCDGVDNDGNGVIDDPDVCWAPVYAWAGPEGTRCYGLSPKAPPDRCSGYDGLGAAPSFSLLGRARAGARPVHQCSLGLDHALVEEAPLFADEPDAEATTVDAWRAVGYDCALTLGWSPEERPELAGDRTPAGEPSPIIPYAVPLSGGGTGHAFTLGGETAPHGGVCNPGRELWVFRRDAPAPGGTSLAGCPTSACEPRASGRVLLQTPADGATFEGTGSFVVTWRLQNSGELRWPAGWYFVRHEGHWSESDGEPLTRDVLPGESVDFEVFIQLPERGLDLTERWALHDDDGETVVAMDVHFNIALDDEATLLRLEPAAGARFRPGDRVTFRFEVENSGSTTWDNYYKVAHRAGDALANDLFGFEPQLPAGAPTLAPGEAQTIEVKVFAPAAPGRYVDTWSIRNAGARDIPITIGSEVVRTFDTVIDVVTGLEGVVRSAGLADGLTLRPGTPLLQSYLIENVGDTTWTRGWTLSHVSGALSRVDAVALDRDVSPNEEVLLVIPMRTPLSPPDDHGPWRDGWELRDAGQEIIGLSSLTTDGATSYGSHHGAWLWTEVNVGEPCGDAATPR